MAKKVDVKEYQCELIKVVDGDTIDCFIDLGFNFLKDLPILLEYLQVYQRWFLDQLFY